VLNTARGAGVPEQRVTGWSAFAILSPDVRYEQTSACAALRDIVECVWMLEAPAMAGPVKPDVIVPDGCPELVVQLGDPFERLTPGGAKAQPAAFLAGPLNAPWQIRPTGSVRTVGVRFRPGGLARLTSAPLGLFADREVPLEAVLGARASELTDRVASASGLTQVAAEVCDVLCGLVRPRSSPRTDLLVAHVLGARGQVGIDELAREAGLSPRHVQRLFLRDVGLAPKRLARIVRVQEVLRRVAAGGAGWVDLALDCGFADQSHLTREFASLTGESPARWFDAPGPGMAEHFSSQARLQDFFGS
jgi:AraC-like DNA-binding protein